MLIANLKKAFGEKTKTDGNKLNLLPYETLSSETHVIDHQSSEGDGCEKVVGEGRGAQRNI